MHGYIILLFSGFLLVSILPSILNMQENSLAVKYRAVMLGLALLVIAFNVNFSRLKKTKIIKFRFFYFFWMLYAARIIFDIYYDPIFLPIGKDKTYYIQYAFGVVLIPMIAVILLDFKKIDFSIVLRWVYSILFVSLLISIVQRTKSTAIGRDLGNLQIGVLLYGQYGASLAILSLYNFLNNSTITRKIIYVFGFLIGVVTIFISASKSPFLALILIVSVYLIIKFGSFKGLFLLLASFLVLSFYFYDIVGFFDEKFNSAFLSRLIYAIDHKGDQARIELYQIGFNEFIDNPIVGSSMLIQHGVFKGSYPHNLIIESFMATGIFGGFLFLVWVVKAAVKAIKIMLRSSKSSWVGLLFFQYFIFAMFSGNLFSSNLFWLFSILVVGIPLTNKKQDFSVE